MLSSMKNFQWMSSGMLVRAELLDWLVDAESIVAIK